MPIEHILGLLIAERDRLNKAIDALQTPSARTGRPPVSRAAAAPAVAPGVAGAAPVKKGRHFTPAQKKKQADKMKAYWAAKRKAAK
jgi:hypothetical protein